MSLFEGIEGALIDLDGTVFQGKELIEGTAEAISAIQKSGRKVVYLSNRGNHSRNAGLTKLREHGIDVEKEDIIFSSTVTAQFIKKHYPLAKVWILGNKGLADEMVEHHVTLSTRPEDADFVVITLHDEINYAELNDAFRATSAGARIIATNSDKTYPDENGPAIDVAGFIGAIESATGQKTELVIGKPSCFMVEAALEQIGLRASQCMVIGDSLGTDISMGRMQGMRTVLVLTGNTTQTMAEQAAPRSKPDYVFQSLADVRGEL
ncbi:HAD-IIA family hydrolase [Alkalicoccobacillus murimartini]|uniref:Arabinose operon protein AraL n=1 Tax=Alkalicoccobacillus murimartini TaxID=171685 RepID=A0ABT9YFC7_9BACI|nr:HAD-IIA family hydrolase [Alkalicoccobacillus murimartini]MDQ0206545.1 arabinose operon protein AraL [Alkalicoccobacillus murimartini]